MFEKLARLWHDGTSSSKSSKTPFGTLARQDKTMARGMTR